MSEVCFRYKTTWTLSEQKWTSLSKKWTIHVSNVTELACSFPWSTNTYSYHKLSVFWVVWKNVQGVQNVFEQCFRHTKNCNWNDTRIERNEIVNNLTEYTHFGNKTSWKINHFESISYFSWLALPDLIFVAKPICLRAVHVLWHTF